MESSALGFRTIRAVAEDGHVAVDAEPDHRAPVLRARVRFKSPQGIADGVRVAHQQAEPPERGQGGALPDEKPEMRAARPVGPEGDQAAERGVREGRAAAVEMTWIEAHLGNEVIWIGTEFDEGGVDRLRDPGTGQANRGWRPLRAEISG